MTRGKKIALAVIGLLVASAAYSVIDANNAQLETENGGRVKQGDPQDE
jgi:hypothetical protein